MLISELISLYCNLQLFSGPENELIGLLHPLPDLCDALHEGASSSLQIC